MNDELARLEREAIQSDGDPELVAAALAYAEIGWAPFPITRTKTPLAGSHGYRDASLRPERLRELFSARGAVGLAIATATSKLVVLDIDPRNGGTESAASVLAGELPPHPVKRTPRGGIHRVFRAPVCSEIATKANALGPGIDVEASGSGVMFAPPTPGYAWDVSPFETPAPFMPLWLWRLLPKVEPKRATGRRAGPRSLRFTLSEALEALERYGRLKKCARGWLAICPAHSDRHNSLSIKEGTDGQPVLWCFACCSHGDGGAGFRLVAQAIELLLGRGAA